MTHPPVHVQVVHSSRDISWLREFLIPSLRTATERSITLWTLGYDGSNFDRSGPTELEIVVVPRSDGPTAGFGANHNTIFRERSSKEDFIILNPDCVLFPDAIDGLLSLRGERPDAGIVEGRQWPFEHPKEFDASRKTTPWASGAFALVAGPVFADIGGFDESFFMYLEDVDLSWRVWLAGFEVLYEPNAAAMHFSGGPFYRSDIRSPEEYYGARNFLMLMKKFFGEDGVDRGLKMVRRTFTTEVADRIEHDFRATYMQRVSAPSKRVDHPQIKVLGFNRFHDMRKP